MAKKNIRIDLSTAPLSAFTWFTLGASMLGIATFALVYYFILGNVSQSADTVAAISGFAISVSGSVVAIVLAARSLQQQDDISEVEQRAIARDEAREAERELRESIGPLRDYLAANRIAFNAVELAADRLAQTADVPRTAKSSEKFKTEVAEARDEAVCALVELADSLAVWPDVRVLADAMQEPRHINGSSAENDARRITNRMSKLYVQLSDLSQSDALSAARNRHANFEWEEWQNYHEVSQTIAEHELSEAELQDRDVRIDPDRHESKWFSFERPKANQPRAILSGVEPAGACTPSALPECIELIREMATELSRTSAATLWGRRVQATFSTRVQSLAVFDPTEPGGYHMSASARRPLRTLPLPETDSPKPTLRPWKRERTREADSKEKQLLKTAHWVGDPTQHDRTTSLNCLLLLSDPAGYFTTFDEPQSDNLAKGGDLPRFPLLLNRGAAIILRAVAEIPSSAEIETALDRKLPALPPTATRMIPTEEIDTFCTTALTRIMPELIKAPDKVFCPALNWGGHRRRFEMQGVDLAADVRAATERKIWPPYPQWPGPRPRVKPVPSVKGNVS
ncbi:hypothetical protein [Roseivivax halodurans]|uniref:hypothetical protein n=1 Tax=Roseivivax halodurans TaxID=93683 RepID=UPI0004B9B9FC|nr:hypothetical protein [Roseivivax halodurans]